MEENTLIDEQYITEHISYKDARGNNDTMWARCPFCKARVEMSCSMGIKSSCSHFEGPGIEGCFMFMDLRSNGLQKLRKINNDG